MYEELGIWNTILSIVTVVKKHNANQKCKQRILSQKIHHFYCSQPPSMGRDGYFCDTNMHPRLAPLKQIIREDTPKTGQTKNQTN